jgi:hypothetical protein
MIQISLKMDPNMELIPAALQPPSQKLVSLRQSPNSINKCPEKSPSSNDQVNKSKPLNDLISTSDDHDDLVSLHRVQDVLREEASMEPSLEVSLFVNDSQDTMEDVQIVENNTAEAKNYDQQDSHVMNDDHIVEHDYAMEDDLAIKHEEQRMPQAFGPDSNSEEDPLPKGSDVADQILDGHQSPKSREVEVDDIDVAEEDEGSEFDGESSISSDDECEYEAPARNRSQTADKKSNKPRRKLALTPQDRVSRLHEKEDQKLARKRVNEGKSSTEKCSRKRKRKLTGGDMGPSKALKMASGNSFFESNSCASSSNDDPLLSAQSIEAKTHSDQMAQIMASIPDNFDTRRKSTQKKDLIEAKSVFGYKKVEADNGMWRIKGMQTSIHSYQLTAVAWMIKREWARMKPFGGILADTMGMGKTVMSLACIIGNQASDADITKFCKATLVVVPNKEIAAQWEEEAQVG